MKKVTLSFVLCAIAMGAIAKSTAYNIGYFIGYNLTPILFLITAGLIFYGIQRIIKRRRSA
jgi:hypothetical protein